RQALPTQPQYLLPGGLHRNETRSVLARQYQIVTAHWQAQLCTPGHKPTQMFQAAGLLQGRTKKTLMHSQSSTIQQCQPVEHPPQTQRVVAPIGLATEETGKPAPQTKEAPGVETNNQQMASGYQHPGRFAQQLVGFWGEVQSVVQQQQIHTLLCQRQMMEIGKSRQTWIGRPLGVKGEAMGDTALRPQIQSRADTQLEHVITEQALHALIQRLLLVCQQGDTQRRFEPIAHLGRSAIQGNGPQIAAPALAQSTQGFECHRPSF